MADRERVPSVKAKQATRTRARKGEGTIQLVPGSRRDVTGADGKVQRVAKYDVRVSLPGARGKQVRKQKRIEGTIADATAALDDLRSERRAGQFRPRTAETFGDWLDRWMTDERGATGAATLAAYAYRLRKYATALLPMPIAKITHADVQKVVTTMVTNGAAWSHADHTRRALHRAFELLVRPPLAQLASNPARYVTIPPAAPAGKERRSLTDAEVARVIAGAPNDRLGALWLLMLTTGLRPSEACALRWSDIRAAGMVLSRAATHIGGRFDGESTTKTERVRTVPLQPMMRVALERHRDAAEARMLAEGVRLAPGIPKGIVFCTTKGGRLTPSNILPVFRRFLARIEVDPTYTPYELRHTFATRLVRRGKIKEAQQALGHKSITMTLDAYSHVATDDVAAAITNVFPELGEPSGTATSAKKRARRSRPA